MPDLPACVKPISAESYALACPCDTPCPATELCPGLQVTKVRVTALVGNTYHARVHYAPGPGFRAVAGAVPEELDVDARPSDAINLAIRFNAPIYVSKGVAAELHTPAPCRRCLLKNAPSYKLWHLCGARGLKSHFNA